MDSKALIEAAIHEVGDGNMYAEKASTSLREVVDGIECKRAVIPINQLKVTAWASDGESRYGSD